MNIKKNGISLIVLVITIIVIIILAGAVIVNLSTNNPIKQSNDAKMMNDLSTLQEKWNLAYTTALADNAGAIPTDLQVVAQFGTVPTNYSVTASGIQYTGTDESIKQKAIELGVGAPIPTGFYYVGGNIDSGLVISDNIADANKGDTSGVVTASGFSGNQFVWVPVNKISGGYANRIFFTETFTSSTYKEDTTTDTNYSSIDSSITKYGGFYIARYEASDNGSGTVKSVAGATPWVNISDNNATTGAIAKSKAMYSNNYVQSNLVTGKQWDTVMEWMRNTSNPYVAGAYYIKNSTGMGKYNVSAAVPTGSNSAYAVKNIYDMAGNVWEWTIEYYGSSDRSIRGGYWLMLGGNYPAASRLYSSSGFGLHTIGFRPALYIK